VVAWGRNNDGQCAVPGGLSNVVAIAAGGHHSLAVKSDGTVVAWGAGKTVKSDGLNIGQSLVPTGLSGVIAVAAGELHSVALKSDGTVLAWGWDAYGMSTVPTGLSGAIAIAAGG